MALPRRTARGCLQRSTDSTPRGRDFGRGETGPAGPGRPDSGARREALRAQWRGVVAADDVANGDEREAALTRSPLDALAGSERALIQARTRAALGVTKTRGERTGGVPLGASVGADGRRRVEAAKAAAVSRARELQTKPRSLQELSAALDTEGTSPAREAVARPDPRADGSGARRCPAVGSRLGSGRSGMRRRELNAAASPPFEVAGGGWIAARFVSSGPPPYEGLERSQHPAYARSKAPSPRPVSTPDERKNAPRGKCGG